MASIIIPRSMRRILLFSSSSKNRSGIIEFRNWTRFLSDAAVPKPKSNEERSKLNLDPFGIQDIDDRSSTVLVQGYFEQNWEKTKKKKKNITEEGQENENVVPEQESNAKFKKYDGWLRSREFTRVREKHAGGAESRRPTSFGEVRLDSDNIVENDGQFGTDVNPADFDERRPFRNYSSLNNNDMEFERSSNPKSMLAADFLKKTKLETTQDIIKQRYEQNQQQEPPKELIENARNPKLFRRKTAQEEEQDRFTKIIAADSLDSNHIPKIYQLPAYNNMTQDEMWSAILKHTVIFQNDYVFAINKPNGVPIHSKSLDCRHYITQFLPRFAELANVENIFPLHRLDKETSGVLLFAKDIRIAKYLTEKFGQRQIDKKYFTVTKGCPEIQDGTIKIPIGQGKVGGTEKYRSVLKPDLRQFEIKSSQKQCRQAITHFQVISSIREAAFLEVTLETGVQHQIRIHLGLALGCPVIGDHKYSHRDRMAPQRLHPFLLHKIKVKQSKVRDLPLHLHCSAITFTLPDGAQDSAEPIYVHAKVPDFFKHTLRVANLKN